MGHSVFVYGTLMKGLGNHRLLERSRFAGEVWTAPQFTMVSLGGFPGLLAGGLTQIRGEVYEVDDEVLAALDRLEGHPTFYRRQSIMLEDGLLAQAYVLENSDLYRHNLSVPSGDWREYPAVTWSSDDDEDDDEDRCDNCCWPAHRCTCPWPVDKKGMGYED